jgi:uncharacterized small protein (TIGR04563 family)
MLQQMEVEAHRQDRSMSWIVRQAWLIAKQELRQLPSANPEEDPER